MSAQSSVLHSNTPKKDHRWKFIRLGGLDQVVLETADDILNLSQLDQKLWVALSCPVQGLELDEKTLALVDTDKDGRIRVPEILAAIDWLAPRLNDVSDVLRTEGGLELSTINTNTPEGKTLQASAKQILVNLGQSDAKAISVATTTDTKKIFAETLLNGDGVVPAAAASTPELQQLIADIIATQGAETDLSGKPGINQAKLDAFYADIAAHAAWAASAGPDILPLGFEATTKAHAALKAVGVKIDDYFARCRLASFDARTLPSLNRSEADYVPILAHDLHADAEELAAFPIAQVAAGKPLSLADGINPAWTTAIATLQKDTITPLLGSPVATLTQEQWAALKGRLAPYAQWLSTKAGASIDSLGSERIQKIHATAKTDQAALTALIASDKALEPEAQAIADVDRLVRLHRDMRALLHNFVNFTDFYSPERTAIFQAGVLFFDTRSCELCIQVSDPAAHSVLASLSKACIAYCDLKRPNGETMKIAACFTQGDSDFLMVGRNGIFYDRRGRDWDATITKLIDNPISVRQAFWAPYKKFIKVIEEQVAKRAAAADTAAADKMTASATGVANADAKAAVPAKKIDVGTVAAIGVAVGAISGALAALATGLMGLALWQILLVPVAFIVIISGPAMFIAWLKLRQRTLGPILDATGWAINGRVKINVPLGTSLTERAELPANSQRSLKDPYEDKGPARRRRRFILIVLLLLIIGGAGWTFWDHQKTGVWIWDRLLHPHTAEVVTPVDPVP